MTHEHYKRIAEVIADMQREADRYTHTEARRHQTRLIAERLAGAFGYHDQRFDVNRFLKTCNVK